MAELELKTPQDLTKLEGWEIIKAENLSDGVDPYLVLQLRHIAAEKPIKLVIRPATALGRCGNLITCNLQLRVKTEDV